MEEECAAGLFEEGRQTDGGRKAQTPDLSTGPGRRDPGDKDHSFSISRSYCLSEVVTSVSGEPVY